MAGKVADKAQITETKKDVETVEPKQANTQEMAAQIAGEAVRETMKEFMPMFSKILESVANNQQPQQTANVILQEDLRSTSQKVIARMNREFDARVARNQNFMKKLADAPRSDYVIMSIPRVFAKYFGSQLPVGLNGSVIQVPINGRPFRIHKAYVPIIQQTLNYEDQKIAFMEQTDFEDVTEVDSLQTVGRV